MCNHIFEGRADGVTCRLCGHHMTPEEYDEYLRPSAPEEPENVPEVPEATTGKPQAEPEPAPKKPRASRKKKEASADE